MTKINIKDVVENLVDTFLSAGKISLDLRNKGLIKETKSDNTPVSNGDLEVNKIISQKISKLTPDIPIISEETSDNKSISLKVAFLFSTLSNILHIQPTPSLQGVHCPQLSCL